MNRDLVLVVLSALSLAACTTRHAEKEITFTIVNPEHPHAAMIQQFSHPQVSDNVYLYAPPENDLEGYMTYINQYNSREENPSNWNVHIYHDEDYIERMLAEKKGNVLVAAGKNGLKTNYVIYAIGQGFNILADYPLVIEHAGFGRLLTVVDTIWSKGLVCLDLMKERFDITNILMREIVQMPSIYGHQLEGTLLEPAVKKHGVFNLYRDNMGKTYVRPAWSYDIFQQGECITNAMVPMVDLVQWQTFPDQSIDYQADINVISASHDYIKISKAQFRESTQLDYFPDYLMCSVENDTLSFLATGKIDYTIKGVHVQLDATWDANNPSTSGNDCICSLMRGSRANLVIRQGETTDSIPELYIEPTCAANEHEAYRQDLSRSFEILGARYEGLRLEPCETGWHVLIPSTYRISAEQQLQQSVQYFINCMEQHKMPDWELPNMIAKYYTTTMAWRNIRMQP